jgi:plastocyanin
MKIRTLVGASALAALSVSGAAFGACDPTLEVVEIAIKDMAYQPAAVEVCVGQKVRWTNLENPTPTPPARPMKHTVTFDASVAVDAQHVLLPEGVEAFDSGFLSPNQTFEFTFEVAGEYKYFCRPHESMGHLGTLTVVEPE